MSRYAIESFCPPGTRTALPRVLGGLFSAVLLGDLHGAVSRMAAAFAFTSGLVMGRHPASIASRLSGDRRPAPICRPGGDAGQREALKRQ